MGGYKIRSFGRPYNEFTRVTIEGTRYKQMIDIMNITGEKTYVSTVNKSIEDKWQRLAEQRMALSFIEKRKVLE